MKINEKVLNLPPYLSTTWFHVAALHMKGNLLVVSLTDGNTVTIPGLPKDIVDSAFRYHALFLENEEIQTTSPSIRNQNPENELLFNGQSGSTIRFAIGPMGELGQMMQHNPAQANAPDLPSEILQKVSALAKMIAPEDETVLPKPEPSCNCFHCQIARAINHSAREEEIEPSLEHEEVVHDEELQFQQWTITQTGEKLFSVTSRLDESEKYHVYLGHPVGCTCGQDGCEHILAVLKS